MSEFVAFLIGFVAGVASMWLSIGFKAIQEFDKK